MSLKSIYDRVNHILERNLQLNKESVISLQALNLNGFKRAHRWRVMYYIHKQLKLANILFNIERSKLDISPLTMNYSPNSLQEHLQYMINELEQSIEQLGMLNKQHFEEVGNTSKIIEDIIYRMLDDLGNLQRHKAKMEQTDWLEMFMFELDDKLHCKYKEKEKEKDYE